MTYHYTYRSAPQDLVRLSLDHVYHEYTAIINIVFTVAMVCLLVARWNAWGILGNIMILLGVMVFPVFQPLAMYMRSRQIIMDNPGEIDLTIDESAIHVKAHDKTESIKWEKVAGIYFSKGLLVLYPDQKHGYVLTERIVGQEMQPLTDFCKEQCARTHPKKSDGK